MPVSVPVVLPFTTAQCTVSAPVAWSWTRRSFVGKKQKNVNRREIAVKGDQYIFVGMASSAKAIISYRVGKRDTANTTEFLYDLRERVLGAPEISTDGFLPYRNAIRDAFHNRAAHGVVVKTYSVTNLAKQAAVRYSPAQVVAVSREAVSGVPIEISTSYVERQNLTLRMAAFMVTVSEFDLESVLIRLSNSAMDVSGASPDVWRLRQKTTR